MTCMTVGLGIDTGGTYTDAALVDVDTGEVLSHSKDLTTRENLITGITGAVHRLDRSLLSEVSIVSLSTTLATNSLVEGKGCRVGAICIGREYIGRAPADVVFNVAGGHDLQGCETSPLDEDGIQRAIEEMRGRVDAVAVTGYLSVRNPEHEDRAGIMIRDSLGVPVVLGHILSSGLGFNERTSTAIMNARLIPVISDLISSVRESMKEMDIHAPLMIVKGDGTIMNGDTAEKRPVETVLSGPASSLIGAMSITGLKDGIMVDMGGTTTDIGVIRNGFPRLEKEGAMIDDMRTRILAVAVSTYGIGGDSRILVNGTAPAITPVRVMPLCIASSKWSRVRHVMEQVSRKKPERTEETVPLADVSQPTELFIASRPRTTETLQACDISFLEYVAKEPHTLEEAEEVIGAHRFEFAVSKMERLGLITRIGVTPTDLLHAEGTYTGYDREASYLAVGYLARKAEMPVDEFIRRMKDMVVEKISTCIMKDLVLEDLGKNDLGDLGADFIHKSISGEQSSDFAVRISLNKPLIGIGAPVRAWMPEVARRLDTEIVIPEMSEVGNAIGAVRGSVSETSEILIRPKEEDMGINPACDVFSSDGTYEFGNYEEAERFAKGKACETALAAARSAGAADPVVECSVDRREYRNASDCSGKMLLECRVVARATGKPDLLYSRVPLNLSDGTVIVATSPSEPEPLSDIENPDLLTMLSNSSVHRPRDA